MDQLYAVLSRHTTALPRRVALVNDTLVELKDAPPGTQECSVLSRVCEILRESRGERVYTRDAEELISYCLHHDDERGWMALCDDVMCDLITAEHFASYFQDHPQDSGCFVRRFKASSTALHCTYIMRVFSECIHIFSEDAMPQFLHSLRFGQGTAFVSAVASHAKSLPHATRQAILTCLGSSLSLPDVFAALVHDVFPALQTNPLAEDVLAILMASPCAALLPTALPQDQCMDAWIETLLTMASKSPIPRRAPYCVAMAWLLTPSSPLVPDCRRLIMHTLQPGLSDSVIHGLATLIVAIEPGASLSNRLAAIIAEKISLSTA